MNGNLELMPLTTDNFNEKMKVNIGNIEEVFKYDVLNQAGLKQGILYNCDSLCFGDIESLNIDILNIMEARFFNDEFEVNIINDGELHGNIAIQKSNDMILLEKYKIYSDLYSEMNVKQYMDIDEDGQTYIKYVKPCDFISKGGRK